MVTVDLGPEREEQLRQLAKSRGEDVSALARQAIEDFLDVQGWTADTEADWAAASLAMSPEVLTDDAWDEDTPAHGPR